MVWWYYGDCNMDDLVEGVLHHKRARDTYMWVN